MRLKEVNFDIEKTPLFIEYLKTNSDNIYVYRPQKKLVRGEENLVGLKRYQLDRVKNAGRGA